MAHFDVHLRGGLVLLPDQPEPVAAEIGIIAGQIAAIAPELTDTAADTLDATGLVILPGGVDAHVHFNEPGRSAWEGWATGTRALAAGGVTCCIEMPLNASPPTLDAASLHAKLAAARASAYVDFALWGGLTPANLDTLDELAAGGVIGFKAFMCGSGITDFQAADEDTLHTGMRHAAQLGLPVAVHAEHEPTVSQLTAQARAAGATSIRAYLASRPIHAEQEAIQLAAHLAHETGCRLHVVHVSSGQGVQAVLAAQARGVDISCETCPHYLVLTDVDVEQLGAVAKCAPPIRSAAVQAELWAYLADGRLPMVASDHSPAPPDMKTAPDFFAVWGGISGCQATLPLLLDAGYHQRGIPLATLARAWATYPAQRFGLGQRKGQIAIGYDADLVLVDLAAQTTVQASNLFYRHPHSPYIGRTLRGVVVQTLVRGVVWYQRGQIVGQGGWGAWVAGDRRVW